MVDSRAGSAMARSTLAFLRKKIVSGEWTINGRIPKEPELMELLGVGRTTVREAVRSLAALGMLETVRGVGTFVRSQTPISPVLTDFIADYDLREVLVLRRALEVEAAQLAAANRTEADLAALRAALAYDRTGGPRTPPTIERGITPGPFHHHIFEAARTPLLAATYSGVMAAVRTSMHRGQIVWSSGHDERQADHEALIEAIAAQDAVAAAHVMAAHANRDLRVADPEPDPQP